MYEILQQFIPQLSHDEKVGLLNALKAALAEGLARSESSPVACPRCGDMDFVKKGRGSDGTQRYSCKGCNKTFSGKTYGLLANSKLHAKTWMVFAECMADSLSLRESAARCGISLYTSWFMRMRVCEVMRRCNQPARKGTFHVDDTLVRDSLSGNHEHAWFKMPRKAYRNGQDGARSRKGRSKAQIAVECGINEYGDCFCEALERGAPSAGILAMSLARKIPEGSTVISDGLPSYEYAAQGFKHIVIDPKDPDTGNINMVNALHSRLKSFLRLFKGISTRRLQRYLDWFCYKEQFKSSDMDRRKLLFSHELDGRYFLTRALTHLEIPSLLVFWTRKAQECQQWFNREFSEALPHLHANA